MEQHSDEWRDEFYDEYARIADEHGVDSGVERAFARWHANDQQARAVMAEARLLKAIFGWADPSKWTLAADQAISEERRGLGDRH